MKDKNISPYRWVIVIATLPIIIAVEMMWLTFSPIASIMVEEYGASLFAVNMLGTSFMIMFVLFGFRKTGGYQRKHHQRWRSRC